MPSPRVSPLSSIRAMKCLVGASLRKRSISIPERKGMQAVVQSCRESEGDPERAIRPASAGARSSPRALRRPWRMRDAPACGGDWFPRRLRELRKARRGKEQRGGRDSKPGRPHAEPEATVDRFEITCTYFFIDLSKTASAFFAFSSATFARSSAIFARSSARTAASAALAAASLAS